MLPKTKNVVHERHAKDLHEIPTGSTVRIRTDKDKTWSEKGQVIEKRLNPISYNILNSRVIP